MLTDGLAGAERRMLGTVGASSEVAPRTGLSGGPFAPRPSSEDRSALAPVGAKDFAVRFGVYLHIIYSICPDTQKEMILFGFPLEPGSESGLDPQRRATWLWMNRRLPML